MEELSDTKLHSDQNNEKIMEKPLLTNQETELMAMSINSQNLSQKKRNSFLKTIIKISSQQASEVKLSLNDNSKTPVILSPQSNKEDLTYLSSLKKKRNKKIKIHRHETEENTLISPEEINITNAHMKTSLSMSSLRPDGRKDEQDTTKDNLKVERPYNSLKKNVTCNFGNKHHRYSWGSGHSSSSLHSATFSFGSGKDDLWAAIQTNYNYIMDTNLLDSCKEARCEIEGVENVMNSPIKCCLKILDDTNRSEYQYEDPKDLRKWLREMENKIDSAPSLSEATLFSIAELQKHLAEHSVLYHEIVSHARIVSACIRSASEKERQLALSIISEKNNSLLPSVEKSNIQNKSFESTPDTSQINEDHLERLQNRYHLLYLKAFEVQLFLDGLLRKKTSSANILNNDDNENVDSSDSEINNTREYNLNSNGSDLDTNISKYSSSDSNMLNIESGKIHELTLNKAKKSSSCKENKGDCIEGNDEGDQEKKNVDSNFPKKNKCYLSFNSTLINFRGKKPINGLTTLTDFEADSESSDLELVRSFRRQRKVFYAMNSNKKFKYNQKAEAMQDKSNCKINENDNLSINIDHLNDILYKIPKEDKDKKSKTSCKQIESEILSDLKKETINKNTNMITLYSNSTHIDMTDNKDLLKNHIQTQKKLSAISNSISPQFKKNIAIITPNINKSQISARVLRTVKQQQHLDISKFNRSNRKSKNCAIFYFKHLDTDNETKKSVEDDTKDAVKNSYSNYVTKSGELSSDDDEGWLYSSAPAQINHLNSKKNTNIGGVDFNQSPKVFSLEVDISNSYMQNKKTFESLIKNSCKSKEVKLVSDEFAMKKTNIISGSCSSSKSSHCGSSSCSSNDFLTETTTSATTTTQITSKNSKQQKQIHSNEKDTKINNRNSALLSHRNKHIFNISRNEVMRKKKSTQNNNQYMQPNTGTVQSLQQSLYKIEKENMTKNSIKKIVPKTENFSRSESLITPTNLNRSLIKISSTVKKRKLIMPGPSQQRVQEWLEHQPSSQEPKKSNDLENCSIVTFFHGIDDCEASGEASESESVPQPSSDNSEELTDSIATCMQTSTTSQENSTDIIRSFNEALICNGCSNQSLNQKVIKRSQKFRKSERPWSVSCLSQLNKYGNQIPMNLIKNDVKVGLTNHSISESALDSLSPERSHISPTSIKNVSNAKSTDSKGSLRRRKNRKKKFTQTSLIISSGTLERNTNSISEYKNNITKQVIPVLLNNYSLKRNRSQEIFEKANSSSNDLQKNVYKIGESASNQNQNRLQVIKMQNQGNESDDDSRLVKPKFRIGSYTTAFMKRERCLGSLAALGSYLNEDEQQEGCTTGTEDHHSSFSETAWDNYQEKYNSENYSEGFDSDAARRLLEFGDDYRNFIDSQSDCCSSLSAPNNIDSLSPPSMDSLHKCEMKKFSNYVISSGVDHFRRRRALELEYDRRRKTLEVRRKSGQDFVDSSNSRAIPSSANGSLSNKTDIINSQKKSDSVNSKLEFGKSSSAQSLRRTSESDNSMRRRKCDERRRCSKILEKKIKIILSSSSSKASDTDEEREIRNLLLQSSSSLDNTCALKNRHHLLRPEDFAEIITTCRDNIRCLESVLQGPPGAVLSVQCITQTKDLLTSWDNILNWSESTAKVRKLQKEIYDLKQALSNFGIKSSSLIIDSEPSIKYAIDLLENEKIQLQNYRTNILHLNAAVHGWLTHCEKQFTHNDNSKVLTIPTSSTPTPDCIKLNRNIKKTNEKFDEVKNQLNTSDNSLGFGNEFQKYMKEKVSEMYSLWDEADARIRTQIEMLTNSLAAWRQFESGLMEFQQTLGNDRSTLQGLEGELNKGETTQIELEENVKIVAKLLSEKFTTVKEYLDPNHIFCIAKFTTSNGSLSDSGISDGGTISDGSLSERDRRLGVLRRLAKQLESALAPGSEALKLIAARMEFAETELKNLQNTCRDLIFRTATNHKNTMCSSEKLQTNEKWCGSETIIEAKVKKSQTFAEERHKQKKQAQLESLMNELRESPNYITKKIDSSKIRSDSLEFDLNSLEDVNNTQKNNWRWRLTKVALPMQLTLFILLCAACLMQPNCCDNLNTFSMSFTPQLRYIRGPPPF